MIYKASRAAGDLAAGVGQSVADAVNAVDPRNRDNVFYSGVNSVGGAIADDPDWSLGGWLYDLTHTDPMQPAPTTNNTGSAYDVPGLPDYFAP